MLSFSHASDTCDTKYGYLFEVLLERLWESAESGGR